MNLLQIVQEFSRRRALPVPTGVQSSADSGVQQIQGLLNEFCEDLIIRKVFQANTIQCLFTSTAGEDQGDINTLCPYGYQGILLDTFYDRTQRLPLQGGVSPAEWQARKAYNITGPLYQFRIMRNRLLFTPALPVDHEIAFEYQSSYFIKSADAVPVYRPYWLLDTDTLVMGSVADALPLAWLMWIWNARKGFEYAEDFVKYERLIATMAARDARPQPIDMSNRTQDMKPGIFVPWGNWNGMPTP